MPSSAVAGGFLAKDPLGKGADNADNEVAAVNAFHGTSIAVQVRDDSERVPRPVRNPRGWLLEQLRLGGTASGATHV